MGGEFTLGPLALRLRVSTWVDSTGRKYIQLIGQSSKSHLPSKLPKNLNHAIIQLFEFQYFTWFSMILKSVIQEIVSKLIPDLVVILVVISWNATAFIKFPVLCSKLNFCLQNFVIFVWKYRIERILFPSDWTRFIEIWMACPRRKLFRAWNERIRVVQVRTSVILFPKGDFLNGILFLITWNSIIWVFIFEFSITNFIIDSHKYVLKWTSM